MNKPPHLLLLFSIAILLANCSPTNTQLPTPSPAAAATPSVAVTLSSPTDRPSHQPTIIQELPTSTVEPLTQPTATLNNIEAALATQASAKSSQAADPANLPRTGIVLPENSLHITSPNGKNQVLFGLVDGVPYYAISHNGYSVITPSRLGFTLLRDASLASGFTLLDSQRSTFDETWTQPWGEVKNIRDQHNELRIRLQDSQAQPRELVVVFRVFDDGVGFRYEFPEQPNLGEFQIMDELTEFAMSGDHTTWFINAYLPNRYEYLYNEAPLSTLRKTTTQAAHTPLTMQTADGLYISIHEAALIDYSSMTLRAEENLVLHSDLVPWSDGVRVRAQTPLKTPWRTIQIAEKPGDLITSYLILNLNEPNKLGDVSWVQPGKYVGIWWGMHLGKWTWGSGPTHGATTANTRQYLEFAAKYGFNGVLVEGWNLGWDGNWAGNGEVFDFTTPYPDFDLASLAEYARSLGVTLIGHHETAAAVVHYESQMEDAFALYEELGIRTVKTGYVGYGQGIARYDEQGNLIGLEWHHGQFMVAHHQRVVETAAAHQIMINIHEPIKDTGLRRTYPNLMTREGARGQEYNAWDGAGGNPPDHVTILPFTRLLAGPMDYTPGILGLTFPEYRPNNQVNHTLAKELALYVVIYSPLQMAADLIENYEGNPAFQFIVDVPADWEETRVLDAQIGDFIATVRKERDGDEWFLGAITDENGRTLQAPLDFLTPGVTYVAQIYADGPTAHWQSNPYEMQIRAVLVDSSTTLTLVLAPGGGQAVRFYPASAEEIANLDTYMP